VAVDLPPGPLPEGFQTKGIVALTFSILAGLLGVGTVVWYGLGEMSTITQEREKKRIDDLARDHGVVERNGTSGSDGDTIGAAR
jgi:iron transport multicopper oxidase